MEEIWFFEEIKSRLFYKSTIPYSASMIRFALLLRYTSYQAYVLLLEILPLPSISLLQKIQQGGVDSVKALKRLREAGEISADVILMFDEMFLRKLAQYQNGDYLGEDIYGELFKGLVLFMIAGLKKSVKYVVQAIPEVQLTGKWLFPKIAANIGTLGKIGFVTRAVCADNHSTNVNAYKCLKKDYKCEGNEYGIIHPENDSKVTYLLFDTVHILKNIRNNLVAAKKFVFPSFKFENGQISVECPAGYISWGDLYKIYDQDLGQQANLKKAPKLNYQALHPGNNKQNVPLALAIFHETTIVAAKSYFPERKDLAGFLSIIHTWWKISNSKTRHNPNPLGCAVVVGDGKLEFLKYFSSWITNWSKSPYFTLTPQTSHALTTTLNAHCELITELLSEEYSFVLTGRLQSDPVERRFSQYRGMNGGCFLVSLREVLNTERIIACRSLMKAGINFWEDSEDLRPTHEDSAANEGKAIADIQSNSVAIEECHLSASSTEVATTISGYIAKEIKDRSKCNACLTLLCSNEVDIENNHYLNLLSRGGLTVPSSRLAELTCSSFAILDFISPILRTNDVTNVERVSLQILDQFAPKQTIICPIHDKWGRRFTFKIIINVFYNNKQKETADSVRKDSLKGFKKRQLTKQ